MPYPEYEIEVDDAGDAVLRVRLGPIDEADPDAVPPGAWDEFCRQLDLWRDGQRAAKGQRDAAEAAWGGRLGDFGGRLRR